MSNSQVSTIKGKSGHSFYDIHILAKIGPTIGRRRTIMAWHAFFRKFADTSVSFYHVANTFCRVIEYMLGIRQLPVPPNRIAMTPDDITVEREAEIRMPRPFLHGKDRDLAKTFSVLTYGGELLGESFPADRTCVCDLPFHSACMAKHHIFIRPLQSQNGLQSDQVQLETPAPDNMSATSTSASASTASTTPSPQHQNPNIRRVVWNKSQDIPFEWSVVAALTLLGTFKARTEEEICNEVAVQWPHLQRAPPGKGQKDAGWERAIRQAMRNAAYLEKVNKPASNRGIGRSMIREGTQAGFTHEKWEIESGWVSWAQEHQDLLLRNGRPAVKRQATSADGPSPKKQKKVDDWFH